MKANNLALSGLTEQPQKREYVLRGIPKETIAGLDKVLGVLLNNVKVLEDIGGHSATLDYLEKLELILKRGSTPEDLRRIFSELGI